MKRLALVAVVAALLVVGVSCSTFQPDAATVNGTSIKRSDFEDLLKEYADDTQLIAVLSQKQQGIKGNGDQTVTAQFAASVLNQEIVRTIVRDEMKRRGVVITDADRAVARTEVSQSEDQTNPGEFEALTPRLQADLVELAAALDVLRNVVGNVKTDDASLQAAYDQNPNRYAQYCARHILLATEAEAAAVKQQLESGADFATLAKQKSTDTQSGANGGDLGCISRGTTVQEFEDALVAAKVGQIVGPVQTQFGFHVIEVTSIKPVAFADAKAAVKADVVAPANTAFSDFLNAAIKAAKVTVDPRYGKWDASVGTVTANA